ncbi:MAG: starch-binding outer membrane lipoprotein SusD [Prevotella sp.]|nr:starch-binding outer membrane lipoprotein SusD [Prevotella sp.]
MKSIFLKTAVAGILVLGMASCADDLNISSIDPNSSTDFNEIELLAKQYATLGVTGQAGPAGKADISGDEGESGFYRTVFNLQELCSDECIWAWQNDTDIPAITNIAWNSSSIRANWAYQRLAYDITLFNDFLTQLGDRTDGEFPHYLAEVRFLRALHYWYFLDLFHKAPFKLIYDPSVLPEEKAGKDLYEWIDQELTEIEPLLATIGSYNDSQNFGRADQGAAYALHARLALNSEIYTDGEIKDYQKAIDYCNRVLAGPYELSKATKNGFSGYEQVFMGDNDQNTQAMKEIIFPIRQDGKKTEEYAGSTYLVSSMRKAGMPYSGTSNYWSCNFARLALVQKFFNNVNDCPIATADEFDEYRKQFVGADGKLRDLTEAEVIAADEALGGSTAQIIAAAGDDRAMFYAGVGGDTRTFTTKQITGFNNGLSIVKWQNRRSDNSAPSDGTFSDTDIPLFRLAEMYLTRAEAYYRLGTNDAQAIKDVNELRLRAHATPITSIDLDILVNEWGREFYMEGRRRSDLVRFGLFTSSKYIWDFKGGVATGTSVDKRFNVYPIPANDISNNPNMTQNPGY